MLQFRVATLVAFLLLIQFSIGLPIDVTDGIQELDLRSLQQTGNPGVSLSRRQRLSTRTIGAALDAAGRNLLISASDVVNGIGKLTQAGGDVITAIGTGASQGANAVTNAMQKGMPTGQQITQD